MDLAIQPTCRVSFARVLDTEEFVLTATRLLGAAQCVLLHHDFFASQQVECADHAMIAL